MREILLAAVAIGVSLGLSLLLIRLQRNTRPEKRMLVGLAATVVHMVLSLLFAGILLLVVKTSSPVSFVLGILVFYLVSLIILVATIVRWMRTGMSGPTASSADVSSKQNPL